MVMVMVMVKCVGGTAASSLSLSLSFCPGGPEDSLLKEIAWPEIEVFVDIGFVRVRVFGAA
jgi:hypothetical protein